MRPRSPVSPGASRSRRGAGAPGLATAVDGCASNRACIFDDNNFQDRIGSRAAEGGRVDVSSGNNDRMDSWKNNTGTNAAWYYNFVDENSDNCRNMPKNDSDGNVGVFNSDELSSWRTDRGC
ncbi:peptidase inhibitor family I36 protein [Nocardioides endophyticus]|uniref:peptidase inhibitor family I36 protein n=1 Tax=Nocardioides endophyticus TaxID=1353775 RepID=UPI0031EC37A8